MALSSSPTGGRAGATESPLAGGLSYRDTASLRKSIRVLVIDDSSVACKVITQALRREPQVGFVESACSGLLGLERIRVCPPDIVTLDVEMPDLSGLETLRILRREFPAIKVIMCSCVTERGARITIEALLLGAADYVTKPRASGASAVNQFLADLTSKVTLHGNVVRPTMIPPPDGAGEQPHVEPVPSKSPIIRVLCIGSSTGGPNALAELFASLPSKLTIPVLIVQHMPAMFTRMLADRLSHLRNDLPCCEVTEDRPLLAGSVYIATGGRHMEVRADAGSVFIHLQDQAPENSCRPSVDVLFRSVAAVFGGDVLAVILTGMGSDGCRGAQALAQKGARILVQDAATSVVWGMPGAVVQAGIQDEILPIGRMGQRIAELIERYRSLPRSIHQVAARSAA